MHVTQDRDPGRSQALALAQQKGRISFEQALIGCRYAGEDVDADEVAARDRRDGERSSRVVAEDVDADRYFDGFCARRAQRIARLAMVSGGTQVL